MGVRLDQGRFDFELQRRGLSARDLSVRIGISEVLLSKARNGHQIQAAAFAKITNGLAAIPILDGADALLAEPVT